VKRSEKNDWDIDDWDIEQLRDYLYRNYDELIRDIVPDRLKHSHFNGKARWSAARKKKARPAHAGPTYDRVSVSQIEESIWDVLAEKWAVARAGSRER
jgi:hypothetical protein